MLATLRRRLAPLAARTLLPHTHLPTALASTAAVSFHVAPGARVVVDAHAPVAVARGAPDAVAATWSVVDGADHDAVDARQVDGRILLTFPRGAATNVQIALPARYASVEAATHGASFTLERTAEADVAVASGGGAVTIDSARCGRAAIDTGGGPLHVAAELQASELSIDTHGGALTAAKLAARRGEIATAGGRVAVGALYGDAVTLATGGGDVNIATLNCAQGASIDTAGGAADLGGVDGCADVTTSSGPLHLHLLARAGRVHARTQGGDAAVKLDAGLVERGGGVRVDGVVVATPASGAVVMVAPPDMDVDKESPSVPLAATPPPGGSGRVLAPDASHPPPHITIDARPGGAVHVTEASWFEAAVERAREAGQGRLT